MFEGGDGARVDEDNALPASLTKQIERAMVAERIVPAPSKEGVRGPRAAAKAEAQEGACPFCEAVLSPETPAPARSRAHMSRAMWLAVGSSVIPLGASAAAGCGKIEAVDRSSDVASRGEPTADGAEETTWSDAAAGSYLCSHPAALETGSFVCGYYTCDRATEYCNGGSMACPPSSCDSDCEKGKRCVSKTVGSFPAECVSCPSCACLQPLLSAVPDLSFTRPPNWTECTEQDGGGISITDHNYQFCGGCYGSPPARLARA